MDAVLLRFIDKEVGDWRKKVIEAGYNPDNLTGQQKEELARKGIEEPILVIVSTHL